MINIEDSNYFNLENENNFYYDSLNLDYFNESVDTIRLLSSDFYINILSNKYTTFFITSYDVIHS